MISRQLAVSSAASVFAMAAFVLFGPAPTLAAPDSASALEVPLSAAAGQLPAIGQLLPALR